ncbi:MAG: hypothetical protein ABIG42_12025, partial [bacterium]
FLAGESGDVAFHVGSEFGEDDPVEGHEDERVQERPQEPESGALVLDLEVPHDEVPDHLTVLR